MLSLSWMMVLMVMMMKRDNESTAARTLHTNVTPLPPCLTGKVTHAKIIKVSSGDNVQLPSCIPSWRMGTREDLRWTHHNMLINSRTPKCLHGRCALQEDGSLSLLQVGPEDSGNYTLEVYNGSGKVVRRNIYSLQVKDVFHTGAKISIISLVIFLLLLIAFFILIKMRLDRSRTLGPADIQGQSVSSGRFNFSSVRTIFGGCASKPEDEPVYMMMHGNNDNKVRREEEKKEEEPLYVACHPSPPAEPAQNVYV